MKKITLTILGLSLNVLIILLINQSAFAQTKAVGTLKKVFAYEKEVTDGQFTLDGKYIYGHAEFSKEVIVHEVATGQKVLNEPFLQEIMRAKPVLSADGRYELEVRGRADQRDKQLLLYDLKTSELLLYEKADVNDIAMSPDGKYVVISSDQQQLDIYDIEKKKKISVNTAYTPTSLQFSPNSRYFFWVTSAGWIYTYDIIENKEVSKINVRPEDEHDLYLADYNGYRNIIQFLPDSQHVAVGRMQNIRIYDVLSRQKGRLVEEIETQIIGTKSLTISKGGRYMLTVSSHNLFLYDLEKKISVKFDYDTSGMERWVVTASFDSQGKYLGIKNGNNHLEVFELEPATVK